MMITMKISKIEFSSLLTYSPRGNKQDHIVSRNVKNSIKNDIVDKCGVMSEQIAQLIKIHLDEYCFSDYFNKNVILVPTPKSSLLQPNELWVPKRITMALEKNGLGKNRECLIRETAVTKSASAQSKDRPKALEHYNSMRVNELLVQPKEITLVDDVITRGATTFGAVNRLVEAFPQANIRVFAVLRTISNPDEFSKIYDPCVGTISLKGVDTFRRP